MKIDKTVDFFTDIATLALFDPQVLEHRVNESAYWWNSNFSLLDEVDKGKLTLLHLGSDGDWSARITDGELSKDEHLHLSKQTGPVGLEVVSGSVFLGKGEYLPSKEVSLSQENLEADSGSFVRVKPGKYDIHAHLLFWENIPKENGPDIILTLSERVKDFQPIEERRLYLT